MLLDSNIIIYAVQPENAFLAELIAGNSVAVASVTKIEVLGFHLWATLDPERQRWIERIMSAVSVLPLDDAVTDRTILLRRHHRIRLGDAIVAATALVHELPLVTRNTDDFEYVTGLQLVNPFADKR